MKVGITGQSGFIGYHLKNYLFLHKDIEVVNFDKSFFSDISQLKSFLQNCDVVVHLAGVNRGPDKHVYDWNIQLASQVIKALEKCPVKPRLILGSSTQEERDTVYGRSKKFVTDLFIDWATKNNVKFTSLIIPNVFGPFGKPFYNSVVATFCYQLTHNQKPAIDVDSMLRLIFVGDLVEYIYGLIKTAVPASFRVYPDALPEISVSDILLKLNVFKNDYLSNHVIPELNSHFDVCLFNTFRSYISPEYFPVKAVPKNDQRGYLSEVVKEKTGGQVFYSLTKPGITRGNHYHRRKVERFFVVQGQASLKLRKIGTEQVIEYCLNGDCPSFVDIPIYYLHSITNVGQTELLTLFWANELFNEADPDTYYEEITR